MIALSERYPLNINQLQQGGIGAARGQGNAHCKARRPPVDTEPADLDRVPTGGTIVVYAWPLEGKISCNEKKPLKSITSQIAARSSP